MLVQQGLSDKAIHIYEILIRISGANATEIAEQTGIKRTDVYVHLHALISAGLVERIQINKKTRFRACSPRVLTDLVERERKKVASLTALYETSVLAQSSPHVRVFEGRQQIENLYKDVHDANSVVSWFGVSDAAELLSPIVYPLVDHNPHIWQQSPHDSPQRT